MTESFWAILLALSCIAILAINIFRNPRKKRLPPGPKPWPIVGNLDLLGSVPHQSLHTLSKRYGEIMHLKFGQIPVVVASSPKMARLFLQTHDLVFASRPPLSVGKYTSYNYSDMTWSSYGPYWRQARKIFLAELFNAKKLGSEKFEKIRVEERCNLFSRLHSLSGRPILLRDHLFRYALSATNRMVMGKKYFREADDDEEDAIVGWEEFQETVDEWFLLGGVSNIGDWIPWLNFLDLQGYIKRMKMLSVKLDHIYEYVIDDHLKQRAADNAPNASKDVVDKFLEMADDPNLDVKLARDSVKGLVQNLIFGGADTTPATVEWIVHELMRHPHIYKKAKDELNTVIGRNKWVEEGDIGQLPYIKAIIIETMRLHPLATFLAPHFASEDCRVENYDIPKGTTVLINTWSIGRDPNSWDAPEEFLPERFLGKDIDVNGSNFALLPFGSGRRRCPGYILGMMTVQSIAANLLHGFELKLVDGMSPEDVSMEEKYGLTTHPKHALWRGRPKTNSFRETHSDRRTQIAETDRQIPEENRGPTPKLGRTRAKVSRRLC